MTQMNEKIHDTSHVGTSRPTRNLRGLLMLNGALLLLLAAVTWGAAVHGQSRGRGDYTMVAGGVNGSDSHAVYIADVTNQELIAITYNHSTKLIEGIGYRNLASDAANLARARTARPTP
jgi:hypothetical protein